MQDFEGYSIVRRLPRGGMTDLFLALDENRNRYVIRCLRDPYSRRWKWRRSFFKAAEVMTKLQHPNIVRIYDANFREKQPYMVLEYIEAPNLRALLLNRSELLTRNSLKLLRQLAEALYYVHSMGYLHLDFKPDNILVTEEPHAVLIDFDLVVKTKPRGRHLRSARGTPFYMPPEALAHNRVNEQTDIYAFGVTAYEMYTFHKPFEADTVEAAHSAQTDRASIPRPMSSWQAGISKHIESLVLKCLAKSPKARYPSMSSVLKDLSALV